MIVRIKTEKQFFRGWLSWKLLDDHSRIWDNKKNIFESKVFQIWHKLVLSFNGFADLGFSMFDFIVSFDRAYLIAYILQVLRSFNLFSVIYTIPVKSLWPCQIARKVEMFSTKFSPEIEHEKLIISINPISIDWYI